MADDEVVEETLVEPGREIAAEDGVFAMVDTDGEAEAAAVFRAGGVEERAGADRCRRFWPETLKALLASWVCGRWSASRP